MDSISSRFIDELPEKNIQKNNQFFEEQNDDFEFNQDIDYESEIKSPGWLRYQKKLNNENTFKIKQQLKEHHLDAYIIPKNDEFFNEYAFPNRLKTVSNFSGSAGFAIITKYENYLFVDGRYLIQSKIESGKNFKIIEIPYKYPQNILNNKIYKKIGYDPKLFTSSTFERYFGLKYKLIPIEYNFVDKIFLEKEKYKNYFFNLENKYAGETVLSKVNRLKRILKKISQIVFLFQHQRMLLGY